MFIERTQTFASAHVLINKELQHLGLYSGLRPFTNAGFTSYECNLYYQDTRLLADRAFGKGYTEEAQLGAMCKALEQFTSIASHVDLDYHYYSLAELQAQAFQVVAAKVPEQILNENKYRQQALAWLPYENYSDKNDRVFIPAASINPFYLLDQQLPDDRFPYAEIYLQCSNDGVALGCDRTETLIHAVSECIERDALSFFLADHFMLQQPQALQVIDPKTISVQNQALLQRLQQQAQLSATILLMPNAFGVPSFCTCIQDARFIAPIHGFAAALDADYALYRSIYECIERFNCYDVMTLLESQAALRAFAKVPSLLDCVHFDIARLIAAGHSVSCDFGTIASYVATDIEAYWQELLRRVLKQGFSVYYKILYESENVCTLHAVLPEAESLWNILKGVVPPFGQRITTHLTRQNRDENQLDRQCAATAQ